MAIDSCLAGRSAVRFTVAAAAFKLEHGDFKVQVSSTEDANLAPNIAGSIRIKQSFRVFREHCSYRGH